nr:PHP domain-containing protein [Halovenus carboxidivorans]
MHTHSEASFDGRDSIDLILRQAKAVGLDAVAITDHDEVWASREAVEHADDDLIVIPGMEVSSAAGHVLSLGTDTKIPPNLSFAETVSRIRDSGGLAVVPHPYQETRSGVLKNISEDALEIADAIEVYNSRLLTGRANRQARQFATERDLPMTAGSDAHVCEMVGQAVTEVDPDERTVEGVLTEIRNGRTRVKGTRTPWRISFRQAAGGAKRRVKHRLEEVADRFTTGRS